MYEPSQTTFSATPDETLIAEAIEALPESGERHHTIVHLQDQTVCLSVARAPARDDCWLWFSAAAAERAELDSERLLPLVSAGNFDGWFYVAHEIGAAVPLSEYRRVAELSTARSLALLLGISHALDAAVSQGKPPCEVTPDSVFLDPRLGATIGDLGVAREALGNPPAETDAHAAWVAPEVLRGADAHPRSAVYSFGAIAYTLLTGAPPHRGTPQEIAAADPPRISEARPDLPATLDTVFAVAMANDPRKRYATAAEARHLLNLVIYGAPNAPTVEPTPRFRRRATQTKAKAAVKTKAATKTKLAPKTNGATKAKAQPVRPALVPPPVRIAHPRRRRLLLGALVVAALAGGAVAGTVAAGDGETTPVGPSTITAGDLGVDLPDGWAQQPQPEGRLAAAPVGDSGSGLTIVANGKLPARADRGDAVQLGEYEAWRRDAGETGDGTEKVRYTIPTGGASAVAISCAASAGAAPNTLRLCERMASTLSLDSQEPVELQTVLDAERRWDAAAAKLSRDRAGAREKLAAASRQSGQIEVAERLARVHSADAKRFGELPGGRAVQRAATDAASAYRALAAAARSDSASAWDAARERVRSADERLAQAIAAG